MKPTKSPGTRLIRNSTAEFLIFTGQAGEQSIEARYEDETVWLSQKLMATLFDVDVRTISEHLTNIFASGELEKGSVVRNFRTTASDGKTYSTGFYNLDAIVPARVKCEVRSVKCERGRAPAGAGQRCGGAMVSNFKLHPSNFSSERG